MEKEETPLEHANKCIKNLECFLQDLGVKSDTNYDISIERRDKIAKLQAKCERFEGFLDKLIVSLKTYGDLNKNMMMCYYAEEIREFLSENKQEKAE